MSAVGEAAADGERVDIGEGVAGSLPEADLSQAGGIDQQRTAGQREQFARDRGVAAPTVLAHGLRELALLAQQRVDESRLTHAGRTEQNTRRTGLEQRVQQAEAVPLPGADRYTVDDPELPRQARRGRLGIVHACEIRLGQHQRSGHSLAADQREHPLEATLVGGGRRLYDQRHVDVGRQHLVCRHVARRSAHDCAPPLQQRDDGTGRVDRDPITGHRRCPAQLPARGQQPRLAGTGLADEPATSVLRDHTTGAQLGIRERLELTVETWTPAETGDVWLH